MVQNLLGEGVPDRSPGRPGGAQGGPWVAGVASGRPVGVTWDALGALWGSTGTLWGSIGRPVWVTCDALGALWGSAGVLWGSCGW